MYFSKKIRIALEQARNIGCALNIDGVEFINASGETILFNDGAKIPGSAAVAEEFNFWAKGIMDKEFDRTKCFGHLAMKGYAFSTGGQSFMEYTRKKKPLIIVSGVGVAQLLGKPTIVPILSTQEGRMCKDTWFIYGWAIGDPFRLR